MPQITGPNYQVIAGDWQQLESIINDLTQRFITQGLTASSSPTFVGLTLTGLTASKVVFTSASKALTSTGIGSPSTFIKGDGSLDSTVYLSTLTGALLLNQSPAQTFTAGTVTGTGLLKVASGLLGLDTNTYYKSGDSPTFANITDSGLTITRIPYASTGGLLVDSPNLTFDNTNLTCLGSGTFGGTIAIGTSLNQYFIINAIKSYDTPSSTVAVLAGLAGGVTQTRAGSLGTVSSILCLNFEASWVPSGTATGNKTMPILQGVASNLVVDTTADSGNKNYTITTAKGFEPTVTLIQGAGSGTRKIVNLYEFAAKEPTVTGTFVIDTLYGFYCPALTKGTANWGFYGLTANNYLSGGLQIGGTATIGMGAGTLSCSGLITATAGILSNSDIKLNTVGNGYYVKEGTNATMGVVTLVLGVATVNTTKVTANSRIFLTTQGGTLTNIANHYASARTAGTSFTITSMNLLDTSDVAWLIIEPA